MSSISRRDWPELTPTDAAVHDDAYRAFDEAAIGMVWATLGGRVVYANPAFCRMLELHPGDCVGLPLLDVTHSAERDVEREAMRRLVAGEVRHLVRETRYVARSGDVVWVLVYASLVRDPRTGRAQSIVTQVLDCTHWKRADEQLRLLRQAVSHTTDLVIITESTPLRGAGPRIVFVNEAFERRTGWTTLEAVGRTPRLLNGPKTNRAALVRVRRALARRVPVREELLVYTKSGGELWLELDVAPVFDTAGRCTHFVALERDVTDRRRLQERLVRSQKMEAVGRLSAGVAHDVNNVLMVVSVYAELLIRGLPLDGPARADAEEILKAARRGSAVTRSLLGFTRGVAIDPRPLDINEVVQSFGALIVQLIGEEVRLRVEMAERPVWVHADPGEIEQVLMNLSLNARDAMPDGGTLTILARWSRVEGGAASPVPAGEYVVLGVRDTGTGMDAATRQRLFEPFYTTKSPGRGTGLGLYTVAQIAARLGGAVDVESAPGAGSAFLVYLPATADPAQRAAEPAPAGASLPGGTGRVVLLVEDDAQVRTATRRVLAADGYTVLVARDGEDALQVAAAHGGTIDLVLTDLRMPAIDGRELIRRLVAARPSLRAVMMSGYPDDERAELDGSAYPMLAKPIEASDLLRVVRDALA
jgi:two-component system cell cycle sensor histidine kinase/response regulator CckA